MIDDMMAAIKSDSERMVMRRLFLSFLVMMLSLSGSAGNLKMRDVFKQMPDSLFPYISENNRLDFIDFIDSNMQAVVTNRLGGHSEMMGLTDSTLSIQMSPALYVDMLLVHPLEVADSCRQMICLVQTYGTDTLGLQSVVSYYTMQWQAVAQEPLLPEAEKAQIASLKVQTILKRDEEILKKD